MYYISLQTFNGLGTVSIWVCARKKTTAQHMPNACETPPCHNAICINILNVTFDGYGMLLLYSKTKRILISPIYAKFVLFACVVYGYHLVLVGVFCTIFLL